MLGTHVSPPKTDEVIMNDFCWKGVKGCTRRGTFEVYMFPAPLTQRTRLVLALAVVWDRTQPIPHSRGVTQQ